ncbi:hypothetical protein Q7C36_008420 [Tachysurus vachellii]|uniref:C-type lectin domain-containing protein n=1 Tax=Tachysurus vachellii TaxID=175792 RepID=A0AA88N6S8_TACVA|nr:hypothetical protein Q7C36_008420 [Tachysurus vachellii]
MNYTTLAYNIFDTQLLLPETAAAETISMWIGLRLVDGEWMWVNRVQLILVKEQKTWEEALQYCRMNYTTLAYNIFDTQLLLPETAAAESISVWIGLRLVNGEWMWVNRVQVKSLDSLPSCVVPRRRCVAYDINTHTYENRDCSEKLNFLCF